MCRQLKTELEAKGKRPYVIPVGGSNSLGTWGYLEAIEEIRQQQGHLVAAVGVSEGREEVEQQQQEHSIEAAPAADGGGEETWQRHAAARSGGREGAGPSFFTDIAMVRERCLCMLRYMQSGLQSADSGLGREFCQPRKCALSLESAMP